MLLNTQPVLLKSDLDCVFEIKEDKYVHVTSTSKITYNNHNGNELYGSFRLE